MRYVNYLPFFNSQFSINNKYFRLPTFAFFFIPPSAFRPPPSKKTEGMTLLFCAYVIDNQTFNIISKNNPTKVLTNTKKTTNFAVSNQLKIRKLEVKNKQQKIKL